MIKLIGGVSFSIVADPEDKRELMKTLSEKGVQVRYFRMDAPGTLEWIFIITGGLAGLIEIYKFLKGKKDKNVDIQIRVRSGETIKVNSKNAEELKVVIDEYENNQS